MEGVTVELRELAKAVPLARMLKISPPNPRSAENAIRPFRPGGVACTAGAVATTVAVIPVIGSRTMRRLIKGHPSPRASGGMAEP
jgi:hypothetical protein